MASEARKPVVVVLCVVAIGFILTGLSMVIMQMGYHRAYAEVTSRCDRVSLVVVGQSRYFCAPVARLEMADPGDPADPAEHDAARSAGRAPVSRRLGTQL